MWLVSGLVSGLDIIEHSMLHPTNDVIADDQTANSKYLKKLVVPFEEYSMMPKKKDDSVCDLDVQPFREEC